MAMGPRPLARRLCPGLGPTYVAAPDCYVVKRTIDLTDGSLRVRRFTVCD